MGVAGVKTAAERSIASRAGGLAVSQKYGRAWMRALGRRGAALGGRPRLPVFTGGSAAGAAMTRAEVSDGPRAAGSEAGDATGRGAFARFPGPQ